jgi:hypothetical protein
MAGEDHERGWRACNPSRSLPLPRRTCCRSRNQPQGQEGIDGPVRSPCPAEGSRGAAGGVQAPSGRDHAPSQGQDTGTLAYDSYLSSDGTRCEVREAYADADAFIQHAFNVREARDALFGDFASEHQMTIYGEPESRAGASPSS